MKINDQGIQKYVKEQVLQVVAIICKRSILGNSQTIQESLLRDVTQLLTSNNRDMQILGCLILKALLNEFAFLTRSSDIGLSWEFHVRCKKAFEVQVLQQIFMLVVQTLQQSLLTELSLLSPEDISALVRLLSLAEQILNWDFSHYHHKRCPLLGEMAPVTLFKPGSSWRELLFDPALVELFFKLQVKLQANDELCHHCGQCLIQLASLCGAVLPDTISQTHYLSNFVQGFLQLSKSLEMNGQAALGLGSIVNRLLYVFPCSAFKAIHIDTLRLFTNAMTDLTCSFLQAVAKEEELNSEDTSFIEAVEQFLEGWASLLEHFKQFPAGLFNESATRILNCYVQCHLAAPDGLRGTFSPQVSNGIHLDEICDLDSDDRELFADQLSTIGSFGRIVPGHALNLLTKLLESRAGQFERYLSAVKNSAGSISSELSSADNLYEDLHWLLLISGYLLADESIGETPLIPQEIISYSSSLKSQVDIQATFQTLCASQNQHQGECYGDSNTVLDYSRVDPVVRLVSVIFRLANLEKLALASELSELLSPQVGRTIVWCLRHWAKSYLIPDEKEYDQLSVTLVSVFGTGTDGGKWTLGFLLDKVRTNLSGWSAESQIVEDSAMLLLSLVNNKNRAEVAISFESLWLLAQEHMSKTALLHELPPEVLRFLTQALVLAGSAEDDTAVRKKYLDQLLQTLQSYFLGICHQPDFTKSSQKEPIKSQVQSLLESFRGVALASNLRNARTLFSYLMPVLTNCVALLNVYQNCPEVVVLVLEFYVDLIDSQITYLDEDEIPRLYEVCMALVQTYGKCNLGKVSEEALTEEEQLNDLLLLIKLLTNLLSKDILNFGSEDQKVSAPDVALYGLHVVIPLMSSEVLKFPVLCSEFFKLTTCLCEMYPAKISLLPDELFKNLMASLEVGLSNYGPDVTKMSLEALSSLATHCYLEIQKNVKVPMHEILQHFLKTLFDMLLLQSFDMDLLQPAAEAFLALICCHQMYYTELVRSLLAQQTDQVVCQRLLDAFNQLTPSDMKLSLDRLNKVRFRKSLDTFLACVKGFLCVK
ncbi:exportin-4-like [Orbicella faveolata]|uniref:exportin-4-like n=1 Tax=Orbicella faveolata TaxID=48498 RepID=UPI0009E3A4AC|nr:exportin-4-like [Orbicella faveolata]